MNQVVTLLLIALVAFPAFGCSRKKQQVQKPMSVSETLAQARAEREAQEQQASSQGISASKSSYIK